MRQQPGFIAKATPARQGSMLSPELRLGGLRTASRQGVGGLAGLADGGTDYRAAARPSNGTGRLTLPGESGAASLPPIFN